MPKDLRTAVGKEHVREALGTSDYREACRRVVYEQMRWKTFFEEERRKAASCGRLEPTQAPMPILHLSEREAHEIAARQLIKLERQFRDWWLRDGLNLGDAERHEVLLNVSDRLTALDGGCDTLAQDDATSSLHAFLNQEGIVCPPTSPAFQMLRPLFRAMLAEHAARKLDVLEGRPVLPRDTQFRELFAHSPVPQPKQGHTLDELLRRFAKAQSDGGRSKGTQMTYEIPARILRDVFGGGTLLSDITRERIETLCDLLRCAPQNAAQRYRGLTLPQAIEAADKASDKRRLKPKRWRTISTTS